MKLFTKEVYPGELDGKLSKVSKAKWIIAKVEDENSDNPLYELFLETERSKYKLRHFVFAALNINTEKLTVSAIDKIIAEVGKSNPNVRFDYEIKDSNKKENELAHVGKLVKRTAFLGLGTSAIFACLGYFNLPLTIGMSGLLLMGQTFETSGNILENRRKMK